ncbi:hypothetical protein GALMADRAFT_560809 [Galerina marginata CBS 339.88]|uniref:Uncharacterized protein n=1 Tax=Galerina marginata (strain CBS 339.88) TaxID=685588 RepID=A0A067SUY8_GALM3|nr:hypothetical protein GALMADRAFT_560809 [Galerina marginata CBS 339.88]
MPATRTPMLTQLPVVCFGGGSGNEDSIMDVNAYSVCRSSRCQLRLRSYLPQPNIHANHSCSSSSHPELQFLVNVH